MEIAADRWLTTEFLNSRDLSAPDGRALYAYRCTQDEFALLGELLKGTSDHPEGAMRMFALYAAEWWQRSSSGHWAWEPLLETIGWQRHRYPDLYEPLRGAWRWWQIDLVRMNSANRYLGTIACQGGLPLALLGDTNSAVTRYLRALMKHYIAYRRFVDDPIDLAREKQNLLKPPTLRRDYVLRLAVQLVESVVHLPDEITNAADPLSALDAHDREWRERMPLDLSNLRARTLVEGLVRDAASQPTDTVADFEVERTLRRTDAGWHLCAELHLPGSVPSDAFARRIGASLAQLPLRFEVRVVGTQTLNAGRYAVRGNEVVLVSGRERSVMLFDEAAADEVRVQFVAGGQLGELQTPARGSALSEMPWVFAGPPDSNEWRLIGEGSASSRFPELNLLLTDDCELDVAGDDLGSALDRRLVSITQETVVTTPAGPCRLRPSSSALREDDYRFAGRRLYPFEGPAPVFEDVPVLRVAKQDQAPRAVPQQEVSWRRKASGQWRQRPSGFGLWEARHAKDGEVRFFGRVYLTPASFRVEFEPGDSPAAGSLCFEQARGLRVADGGSECELRSDVSGDQVRVHIQAPAEGPIPVQVVAQLSWEGADECTVLLPFPGKGARFLSTGAEVTEPIAVGDLHGVRAVACASDPRERFSLVGELRASDLGDLFKVAHIRRDMTIGSFRSEIPLIELRSSIETLFAASRSIDAYVRLTIVDRIGKPCSTLDIYRFARRLSYDALIGFVHIDPPSVREGGVTYETIPVERPGEAPIVLLPLGGGDGREGATLPYDLDLSEQRLLIARSAEGVVARPAVIGRPPPRMWPQTRWTFAAAARIVDPSTRTKAMERVFDSLGLVDAGDPNWAFLTDTLGAAVDLPLTTFNVLDCMIGKPRIAVRALFQLDAASRSALWRLEDELPFSWLLVCRSHWRNEAKLAFQRLLDELGDFPDAEQVATRQIVAVLEEGADRNGGLKIILEDLQTMLENRRMSADFILALSANCARALNSQIAQRSALDDWPIGDGHTEWIDELGAQKLTPLLEDYWLDRLHDRRRAALLDTPVAAAFSSSIMPNLPTPRTTFLVKQIRAFDPDWFDIVFCAKWAGFAHLADSRNE